MGYQVIYDGEKKERGSHLRFRLISLTGIAVLVFLLLVNAHWPRGQEVLRELMLPASVDSALTAVNAFAEDLVSGEEFPEAWETFCHEITHSSR